MPGRELKLLPFQCTASFSPALENVGNMRRFFAAIEREDFVFAWEPRGEWSEEIIRSLCQELELVHCVDPLEKAPFYRRMKYFRLHGGPGYQHQYTAEELVKVKGLAAAGDYVLFNNIAMYEDALRFMEIE